jgi:hypothetical protein
MPDKTTPIAFSVLVPAVPSRLARLERLLEKLQAQASDKPVEILALLDNKKRTVGLKRDALVQAALGRYLAFVDDDDDVADDYVDSILAAVCQTTADVIVFQQRCTFRNAKCISCLEIDGPPFLIDHDLRHEMEAVHQNEDGTWRNIRRKPWHHNAWRAELAKSVHFPDSSFGEDGAWCSQLWPLAKSQFRVDKPLHYYQFDGKTTEAS